MKNKTTKNNVPGSTPVITMGIDACVVLSEVIPAVLAGTATDEQRAALEGFCHNVTSIVAMECMRNVKLVSTAAH